MSRLAEQLAAAFGAAQQADEPHGVTLSITPAAAHTAEDDDRKPDENTSGSAGAAALAALLGVEPTGDDTGGE